MTGHQNTRARANTDVNLGNLGMAVGLGVCLVEQRHALHTVFTGFEYKGGQVISRKAVVQRRSERTLQKCIDLLIIAQQRIRMLGIRRQSLQAISDQLPQRTDILIFSRQYADSRSLCHKTILARRPARGFG